MKTVTERLLDLGLTKAQAMQVKRIFIQTLPKTIDIEAKYETSGNGIHVLFNGDKKHDDAMLEHVAQFSEDQGYNRYYFDYVRRLSGVSSPIDKSFHIPEDEQVN